MPKSELASRRLQRYHEYCKVGALRRWSLPVNPVIGLNERWEAGLNFGHAFFTAGGSGLGDDELFVGQTVRPALNMDSSGNHRRHQKKIRNWRGSGCVCYSNAMKHCHWSKAGN